MNQIWVFFAGVLQCDGAIDIPVTCLLSITAFVAEWSGQWTRKDQDTGSNPTVGYIKFFSPFLSLLL